MSFPFMLNFSPIPRKTTVLFCTLDWLSDYRDGNRGKCMRDDGLNDLRGR